LAKFNKDILKFFLLSVAAFVLYYVLLFYVIGIKTPRRKQLEERSAMLDIRQKDLEGKLNHAFSILDELQERDNNIYRPAFGVEAEDFPGSLTGGIEQLFSLAKTQAESYDRLEPLSESAGKMSSCVPGIPPLYLDKIHMTSRFGVRSDPMSGDAKVHTGVDLAGPEGLHVFATGDGVVEKVDIKFTGYGNEIVINHGFGYKSRYAHLKSTIVHVGDRVKRGDQIGFVGSTGKSTGPHLHYEVEYMGRKVNPLNFFDSAMSAEEYERLVREGAK
jgi:murein DD-endopeptidase MepM/ murein hydrolase activator NlpD